MNTIKNSLIGNATNLRTGSGPRPVENENVYTLGVGFSPRLKERLLSLRMKPRLPRRPPHCAFALFSAFCLFL